MLLIDIWDRLYFRYLGNGEYEINIVNKGSINIQSSGVMGVYADANDVYFKVTNFKRQEDKSMEKLNVRMEVTLTEKQVKDALSAYLKTNKIDKQIDTVTPLTSQRDEFAGARIILK
jgi:hypothetical protein